MRSKKNNTTRLKRIGAFTLIFFGVLTVFYGQPILFPAAAPPPADDLARQREHSALPYTEIKAAGTANLVGVTSSQLVAEWGEPRVVLPSGYTYETWIYGALDEEYAEVLVENDQVRDIKVFGSKLATAPFSLNMTLTDVATITTIYSNFDVSYDDKQYAIELMEEDMNYRPLIAFDNGTFAILYFSQTSGRLMAIDYLDKKTLLTVMPYQLNAGSPLPVTMSGHADWRQINESNQTRMLKLLNLVRNRDQLGNYLLGADLGTTASDLLATFLQSPEEYIQVRIEDWRNRQVAQTIPPTFIMNGDEAATLLETQSKEHCQIYFATPVYDVGTTVLNIFADSLYYSRFSNKEPERIGIAFSKENVLVLLEEENETEGSQ